eukprot:gene23267-30496_t
MYLVDFSCYKPPDKLKLSIDDFKAAWNGQAENSEGGPSGLQDDSPAGPPYDPVQAAKEAQEIFDFEERGGMGCSMGVVAVDLAKDFLKAKPNCNVIMVTTETVTPAFYLGKDKSRLVTNMLFRNGSNQQLFVSNQPSMARRG